jgi:hypothetical protein
MRQLGDAWVNDQQSISERHLHIHHAPKVKEIIRDVSIGVQSEMGLVTRQLHNDEVLIREKLSHALENTARHGSQCSEEAWLIVQSTAEFGAFLVTLHGFRRDRDSALEREVTRRHFNLVRLLERDHASDCEEDAHTTIRIDRSDISD